jgi:hypothetical protein
VGAREINLMVFDFGCRPSADVLMQIFHAARGALACVAIFAGLAVIGRAIRNSGEFKAVDILCGWGLVSVLMTTLAVLYTRPLELALFVVLGAMILATVPAVKQKYFNSPFWCLVLFPGLAILVAINLVGISTWDDFSHWVLNALYIWQNNDVPGNDLPISHSALPGYPYSSAFLTFLASHLAGGFLVQGGAMFNFLLVLASAAMLAEVNHPRFPDQQISLLRIGWLCFAFLSVTFLNPNFNASFTMTNQADTATTVAVGALGFLYWELIDALVDKDRAAKQKLLQQIVLVSMLLVLIKQGNLALVGLLNIAFLLVGWKNKVFKEASVLALLMLAATFLVRYVWQYHVDAELAGNGKGLNPVQEWRWDLVGPVLSAMGEEALRKSGCFGLILFASIYAIISLFRAPDRVRNFAIIVGIVGGGYIIFLMICYLGGAFNERESREAASFYRYGTHVGLLNIGLLWIAAPRVFKWLKERMKFYSFTPWSKVSARACLYAVAVLPLLLLLNPKWLTAPPNSRVCSSRDQARSIAGRLPDNARLLIVEPETSGKLGVIVNFELSLEERTDASVAKRVNRRNVDRLLARIPTVLQGDNVNAIYVPKARQKPVQIMGYANDAAPLFLIREGLQWKQLPPD